jgi:hypothetical protein
MLEVYRPLCSGLGGASCRGGALSRCGLGALALGALSLGAGRGALSLACGAGRGALCGRDSWDGAVCGRDGRGGLEERAVSVRGALSVRAGFDAGFDSCDEFEACELGGGVNGFAVWLSLGRAELVLLLLGLLTLSFRLAVLLLVLLLFEVLLLFGGTKGRLAAFDPLEDGAFSEARFSAFVVPALRLPAPAVARASFGEIDGA